MKIFDRSTRLQRTACAAVALILSTTALTVLPSSPSEAANNTYPISFTSKGIYPRSTPELLPSNKVGAARPNGTLVAMACETVGASVTSSVTTSDIWARTPEGTYLPNAFMETGVNGFTPNVPRCDSKVTDPNTPSWTTEQIAPVVGYTPQSAQEWARSNYETFPHKYTSNCTWFVSNALWKGGVAKTANWTDSSYWVPNLASRKTIPGPTKAASTADYLKNELLDSGVGSLEQIDIRVAEVPNAKVGDLIFYDWDPKGEADGAVDHVVMITGFVKGAPVVTGQSNNYIDQRWQYTSEKQELITSTKKVVIPYIMRIEH